MRIVGQAHVSFPEYSNALSGKVATTMKLWQMVNIPAFLSPVSPTILQRLEEAHTSWWEETNRDKCEPATQPWATRQEAKSHTIPV